MTSFFERRIGIKRVDNLAVFFLFQVLLCVALGFILHWSLGDIRDVHVEQGKYFFDMSPRGHTEYDRSIVETWWLPYWSWNFTYSWLWVSVIGALLFNSLGRGLRIVVRK